MELHQMSVHALTEKLEKAEKELAVAVIENADLRERLSSLESLYRARDKDCAAKEAELERVRSEAQMLKRLVESLARHNDGDAKAAYLNVLGLIDRAALASPAAGIAGSEQCVNGGTCGAGGFCDECEISPDSRQLAIEGQHPCCWAPSKALKELERGMNNSPCILTDAPAEFNDTPLYAHPQPSPDVGALVEAAEAALGEIEDIMQEAYNSAYPVCCGRPGSECCGTPEPEREEADQRMIDRLAPHQKALREALAAHRKHGGE